MSRVECTEAAGELRTHSCHQSHESTSGRRVAESWPDYHSLGDQAVVSTSEVIHSGRKMTFWASAVCHWLYINKTALLETLYFQWCIFNWRCRSLLWYNLSVLVGLFQSSHVFKVSGKSDKFSLNYSNLFCVHFLSVRMQLMLATSTEEYVPQTKRKC